MDQGAQLRGGFADLISGARRGPPQIDQGVAFAADFRKKALDRERRIGLAQQEKEARVIEAAFGVAESKAGLEAKEKEVTVQAQQRMDAEADMSADRAKRVMLIEATANAEANEQSTKNAKTPPTTIAIGLGP